MPRMNSRKWFGGLGKQRHVTDQERLSRRICFEALESRQLLSVTPLPMTTPAMADTTVQAAPEIATNNLNDVSDPLATLPLLETADTDDAVSIELSVFSNAEGTASVTESDYSETMDGTTLTASVSSTMRCCMFAANETAPVIGADDVLNSEVLSPLADAVPKDVSEGAIAETATPANLAWDATLENAAGSGGMTNNGVAAKSLLRERNAFAPPAATADTTAMGAEMMAAAAAATTTTSISGYVYMDLTNSGARTTSSGETRSGIQGVAVSLYLKSGSQWTLVTSTMTASNGAYSFTGLADGTYKIVKAQSMNYIGGKETLGTVGGKTKGTAANNLFTNVAVTASESAVDYNFGERGVNIAKVSMPLFLASSRNYTSTSINFAPVVSLSSSGPSYSAGYKTGTSAFSIAKSGAKITDSDSKYLNGMKITLSGILDGNCETLAASTAGTSITASYSNGVLTLSGVDTIANYLAVLKTVKYSDTAVVPDAGTRTVSVVVYDGISYSNAATVAIAVTVGTTGYTITADSSKIGATKAKSTGFTFANAEVGASYAYTITDKNGKVVSGSGVVASSAQDVNGINVSSLADGTLTFSVVLTDSKGNSGAAAKATATLDQKNPEGYAITANASKINATKAKSTGFTFAAAEVGATYTYTIKSSGGTATVTGSGTVTSANQVVTGLNLSSLADGVLTFSVTLTDAAGNIGTAVTATATLDKTAPSGFSIVANESKISATEAKSTGFTFVGAEIGATYAYTIKSSGGTMAVTGSGTVTSTTQKVAGIDISSLPSGTLTFTVTLTDAAGNAGTAAKATAMLDKTAPLGYAIAATDTTVNAAKATSFGFAFTKAEVGATYAYTIKSSGGTATLTGTGAITSATQSVTGIDVSSLTDGTLTISVTVTDAAGNVGAVATATATLARTTSTLASLDAALLGTEDWLAVV